METLRQQIIIKIQSYILLDNAKFILPYPRPEDTRAVCKKEWEKVDGYKVLIHTINSKAPTLLRRAALSYIINTLTDQQLLNLLEEVIQETEEKEHN
tara:strand:+ start:1575 stop:1865 length:291 start_codon:yes stop_codon:yes gene_type:complete